MSRQDLLLADALINLALGAFLLILPRPLMALLGLSASGSTFFRVVLGAVLVGIGLALMVERYRTTEQIQGLGLVGAVAINLCGAAGLAGWLLLARDSIPLRGRILLWLLVGILVAVSSLELFSVLGQGTRNRVSS